MITELYEDIEIGQQHRTRGRTVTEADLVNFAGMTADRPAALQPSVSSAARRNWQLGTYARRCGPGGRNVRPGLERTYQRGHRTRTRAGRRTGATPGLSTDSASISQRTSQTAMLTSARVAGGPPVAISTGMRTAKV
jgi:hypothetical protein